MSEGLKGPLSTQFTLLLLQTGDASFFSATAQNIGSKGERVIALESGMIFLEYWMSYYFGAFMIYALDLRAIWLLPVFWVDIPADRLSFCFGGKTKRVLVLFELEEAKAAAESIGRQRPSEPEGEPKKKDTRKAQPERK